MTINPKPIAASVPKIPIDGKPPELEPPPELPLLEFPPDVGTHPVWPTTVPT